MGSPRRAVGAWLLVCAAFCLAMVVVGGMTRLTRSGLSIVEWQPLTGVVPPLGEAQWQAEFAKYQASPEGRLVNAQMDLAGFKEIYLVEWAHRLLGRVTGLVVFVPFLFFVATRRLSGKRALRVLGIFALGGVQGFLGWFMVKSGLVDRPHVSHLRLALHLDVALLIFSLLIWCGLDELSPLRHAPIAARSLARPFAIATLVLLSVTITWGAFMAGLHAGHVAPTFPTMNGAFVPDDLFAFGASSLFESALTVHFLHRMLAFCTAAGAVVTALAAFGATSSRRAQLAAFGLIAGVALQIALGAWTVLSHVAIPIAALHQVNAALVLACAVALLHALRVR
jgi:cytochrome c oxidase assembly protein subunit 15